MKQDEGNHAAHTPGPWFATWAADQTASKPRRPAAIQAIANSEMLGQVFVTTDEGVANAILIAGAPTMLRALESCAAEHALIETANMPEWLEDVEAAIAKAKGENQ